MVNIINTVKTNVDTKDPEWEYKTYYSYNIGTQGFSLLVGTLVYGIMQQILSAYQHVGRDYRTNLAVQIQSRSKIYMFTFIE